MLKVLAFIISSIVHAYAPYVHDSPRIGSESKTVERHIIQIDNQTDNNYLFWINPTPIGQNELQLLVKRYFWSIPEGYDFAFGHLIKDPNIEFCNYDIKLGYNFIKLLHPGQSFRLIITSNANECENIDDRIVIVSEKELDKYFDTIPDFFLYKSDHIVIGEPE